MNCLIVEDYQNQKSSNLKVEGNWEQLRSRRFSDSTVSWRQVSLCSSSRSRVSDRKAIEKSSSTKKFREHQMEILYLGGFKQTVYFDTGRLQGYPLCEIDSFLVCWYGFQLGIDQLRCEKVFRCHCFLKTSQPLFIFQVKGFQIAKQLRKAVPLRNSGSIRWRYFI